MDGGRSERETALQAARRWLGAGARVAACSAWNAALDAAALLRGRGNARGPFEGCGAVRLRRYPRGEDVVLARGLHRKTAALREALAARPAVQTPPEFPRVLFLLNALHRVGGVISVVQLANDLRALGCETRVAVRTNHACAPDLGLGEPPLFFRDARELVRRLPAADVVVATLWPTMYLVAELFLERRDFTPAYFVQDIETRFHPDAPGIARLARDSYALTPFCFAKTPWLCEQVRDCGGAAALVPPALDLDLFRPPDTPPPADSKIVLAMLRPSTPRRGFETARAVLERLAARPDVELHAFGSDDAELRGLGLPPALVNHGRVPNEALPALYGRAWFFLECSDFHGFGRTVAEALACGTPAVATRSGGVETFARDGVNALLAPPGDAGALAAAACALLDDPARRGALAAKCRESVRGFDRTHSARETLRVLRGFMNGETP